VKDGSLRIIRNGIGINETATIELPGMKGIWSMKGLAENTMGEGTEHEVYDKYLVVTFVAETRVLAITDDDELDEVTIAGFEANDMTLLCGNCCHYHMVQVTSSEVRLVNGATLELAATWRPQGDGGGAAVINLASVNHDKLLLATGGGTVVLLSIGSGVLDAMSSRKMPAEVACVHLGDASFGAGADGDAAGMPAVAGGGLWSNEAHLIVLPSLETLASDHLGSGDKAMAGIIPRSILLCTLEGVHYLLCALGDGQLFNFTVSITPTGAVPEVSLDNKNCVLLGSQPITLSTFMAAPAPAKAAPLSTAAAAESDAAAGEAVTNIFACSDRPAVIHSSNRRQLLYSNVNLNEITMMSPFHCRSFPNSLALANETSLTIGTIEAVQKLHITTVPLGEQPRRIAHIEHARCFAVCCQRDVLPEFEASGVTGGATTSSGAHANIFPYCQVTVRLVDDQLFDTIDSYELLKDEDIVSCLYATLEDDPTPYFIVGTAMIDNNEADTSDGRIIVFSVDGDRKLREVSATRVNGSCYNLNAFSGGRIVAGIGGTINIFRWKDAPLREPATDAAAAKDATTTTAARSVYSGGISGNKELVWECGHR